MGNGWTIALRCALFAALAVLLSAGVTNTTAEEIDEAKLAKIAGRFGELFMAGSDDETAGMMTPAMKEGLLPQAGTIRSQLTAANGPLKSVGKGWKEDVVQGYIRYRVPVEFEAAILDMRVVFDADDKVAGLFFVAHVTPPAERGAVEAPVDEVEVLVGDKGRALPGTLSVPAGDGPFPAVVLVHGSGPNDRDETVGPNKPFRDLAWGLASRGVMVLRYDKRSHARPSDLIALGDELTAEHEVIDDARAALGLLAGREEVDAGRLFVLGHSLGGTLAPRIAGGSPRPAGIVVLAGAALPLPEKILGQYEYLAALDGKVDETERARIDETRAEVARLRESLSGQGDPLEGNLLGAPSGYYRDLESVDPPTEAARLGLPTLVLQGERDYQVTLEDFERWKTALSGKPGACLRSYAGLDHLFRKGQGTPGPHDYDRAQALDQQVIADIAGFIKGRECPS